MTLDEIALACGTDKASNLHNYTRWYEQKLPPSYADISLLEIGISKGYSLRMWREYYDLANIYGIDINDFDTIPGTRLFKGDQKDSAFLKNVTDITGELDVVIDDGSHRWEDQKEAFKALWPHVAPGGVYVIEDLHTSYFMEFGEAGEQPATGFFFRLIDDVNLYGVGGLGDIRNHAQYENLKHNLNIYQRTIESFTFYKSILFIRKNENAD